MRRAVSAARFTRATQYSGGRGRITGSTEAEALAVKEERYGDAEFLDQLPNEQQITLINAHRDAVGATTEK
ncbi:hypothetical protein [Streptomyces sp. ALI-76-A]|uniref:hypothetical protein n=1 Tax=Streptomyces sp. ALI-76-A TaxID=3025736 RepID=UPI00256EA62D|nr:hypothetical protein [Streptomyces sp. ALI-76-A]MDL5199648.1 hypothetical protein [Streptomyces sp. ALI-76-A]